MKAADFARDCDLIGDYILFNAATGKESKDHVGEKRRVGGAGWLRPDVAIDKSFEVAGVAVDQLFGLGWKHGDVAPRVDREAATLAGVAGLSNGEEAFDVVPALRLRSEDRSRPRVSR
jgi:hypothetical protein